MRIKLSHYLMVNMGVVMLLGCFRPFCYSAKLYDLQDARIIQVYWHRVRNGSGYVYAKINDEKLKGEYATQSNQSSSISFGSGSATGFSGTQPMSAWAQSVGFTFNDAGMQYGNFVMIGDHGTTIEGAYKVNPNDSHGVFSGVARDNKGKKYRLMANWKEELEVPAWAKEGQNH